MFQVIILNNKNQLKTYKIQLHFILVLSKSKIVDYTYKLLILKIHRTAVVFDCVLSLRHKAFVHVPHVLTAICFHDYPLVYIIYLKVSHNPVI